MIGASDWDGPLAIVARWPEFFIFVAAVLVAYAFLKGRELASPRCPGCGRRRVTIGFPVRAEYHEPDGCLAVRKRREREATSSSGDA